VLRVGERAFRSQSSGAAASTPPNNDDDAANNEQPNHPQSADFTKSL